MSHRCQPSRPLKSKLKSKSHASRASPSPSHCPPTRASPSLFGDDANSPLLPAISLSLPLAPLPPSSLTTTPTPLSRQPSLSPSRPRLSLSLLRRRRQPPSPASHLSLPSSRCADVFSSTNDSRPPSLAPMSSPAPALTAPALTTPTPIAPNHERRCLLPSFQVPFLSLPLSSLPVEQVYPTFPSSGEIKTMSLPLRPLSQPLAALPLPPDLPLPSLSLPTSRCPP